MLLSATLLVVLLLFLDSQFGVCQNTRVVIVNTSRYWFNYRHGANGVGVYRLVRRLGVPDRDIIMMSALDIGNDNRNPDSGTVRIADGGAAEWSWDDVELDYRNEQVSAVTFLDILRGRETDIDSGNARLDSNTNASLLIYMAGHGGDEFFKFHDGEELSAQNFGHALTEMHAKGMYKEVLVILDTCQAATMANYITAPNVVVLASSLKGENSYAHATDDSLGVSIVDRFTRSMNAFIRSKMQVRAGRPTLPASLSLRELYQSFQRNILHSTPVVVSSHGPSSPVDMASIKLWRFFGGGSQANVVTEGVTAGEDGWVKLDGIDSIAQATLPARRAAVEELLSPAS